MNVLGGILADSMRVAISSGWSDYVFADDYKLRSLDELGRYIKINKHLPGIPSANDVKLNGIELGSMNEKLLGKIEELHLYILQQNNKNSEQTEEILQLKKQLGEQDMKWKAQQQQIDELKQAVNRTNKLDTKH